MSSEVQPQKSAASVPNVRIGRYEILGEIASGGMATVFLARALGAKGFQRMVAIKRLHPHLEKDDQFVAMFLDEARLAARIRHHNVVPTLDVQDSDGHYIVMEYVEGDRLLGLLRYASKKGERIPLGIVMMIACEALAGLHAAHELTDDDGMPLGLVHRDVSPQNILIGIDGVTKITDFGIAKAESRLSHTREGQLKGKIAYMAPEQATGSGVDRRADVFAMGINVWEMLSGRRLFRGDNDVEVLNALMNVPIPTLRSIVPALPEEIESVVMTALQRDKSLRFSSCEAFAQALEHAAGPSGGLASVRVVAAYVQTVAGPKLADERARIKAGQPRVPVEAEHPSYPSQPSVSSTSAVRAVEPTSAPRQYSQSFGPPPDLASAGASGHAAPAGQAAHAAQTAQAAPLSTTFMSPAVPSDVEASPPSAGQRRWVFALVAVGIVSLGFAGLAIGLRAGGSSRESGPATAQTATTPAPVPASPAAIPTTMPAPPPVVAPPTTALSGSVGGTAPAAPGAVGETPPVVPAVAPPAVAPPAVMPPAVPPPVVAVVPAVPPPPVNPARVTAPTAVHPVAVAPHRNTGASATTSSTSSAAVQATVRSGTTTTAVRTGTATTPSGRTGTTPTPGRTGTTTGAGREDDSISRNPYR